MYKMKIKAQKESHKGIRRKYQHLTKQNYKEAKKGTTLTESNIYR